ncbi:MAG: ParB N-terminal domain-containing protein [Candidatus Bathyarchaeia archaeon]|jgi:SAM-dependent methyltransferase
MTQTLLLKINPEYESLLPPLEKEEYEALKRSIQIDGQHFPITVNADMEVLDGHNRYKVCQELEIEPDFEVKQFEDKLSERMFVVEANLRRRQLNPLDAARLGMEVEKIEAERAKQRQGARTDLMEETFPPIEGKVESKHENESVYKAAKTVGLSPTTYYRAKTILEKASPELQEKVRKNETSIFEAFKQVQQKEHNTIPLKLQIPKTADNLPQELFPTNVWQLSERRPEGYGSADFRGNCCPTIIDQCLRRYLMPFTLDQKILDPMSGSGTFIDVAVSLGFNKNQITAYDLTPRRDDIQAYDTTKLPLENDVVDLIFCHYPYWDMWRYSDNPQDLSNCEYPEFLNRVEKSFTEFKRVLKPSGYLCVLIGNKRESGVIDMEADISLIGQNVFASLWDKIITIVGDAAGHASSAHGNWGLVSARALKNKWTIQNYDTLLVFRKVAR